MDKTKELIEIINKHPDRELIFMYPNEGTYDYSYTLGYPTNIVIDEYWTDGGGRVWLRYDDGDEMFDYFADYIFDDLYPKESYANDEQMKIIDKKTKDFINEQDWKECVCVYISY